MTRLTTTTVTSVATTTMTVAASTAEAPLLQSGRACKDIGGKGGMVKPKNQAAAQKWAEMNE